MTPERQRIVIAELCGWNWSGSPRRANPQVALWSRVDDIHETNLPDYTADFNAAFDALRYCRDYVLNSDQWTEFGKQLEKHHPSALLTHANPPELYYDLATLISDLTPALICECLLKAAGKREEE